MPRAGLCTECGRYVWLAEDGSCRNGHPNSAISFTYEAPGSTDQPVTAPPAGVMWPGMPAVLPESLRREDAASVAPLPVAAPPLGAQHAVQAPVLPKVPPAQAPAPVAQPDPVIPTVGAGQRPPAFDSFAVGAWATAPVWAIAHRRWVVLLGFFTLGALLISIPLGPDTFSFTNQKWAVGFVILAVLSEALSLWVGVSAHSSVWQERHALRIQGRDRSPITVESYFHAQRYWRAVGIVGRLGVLLLAAMLIVGGPALVGDLLVGLVLIAGTGLGLHATYRKPEPRL